MDIFFDPVIGRDAAHVPVGFIVSSVEGNIKPKRRCLQEFFQNSALQHGTVGIDGDQQTHFPHAVIDLEKILPNQRLSAGEQRKNHTLIFGCFCNLQPLFRRQLIPAGFLKLLRRHMDIAHGAVEIAPGCQFKIACNGQSQPAALAVQVGGNIWFCTYLFH